MLHCRILDRATNKSLIAEFDLALPKDVTPLKTKFRWKFPWGSIYKKADEVYKIILAGNLQGLVAVKYHQGFVEVTHAETAPNNYGSQGQYMVGPTLFAIAAYLSSQIPNGGPVQLISKSKLITHYEQSIYAEQVGSSPNMIIYPYDANRLMQEYLI